MTTTLPTSPSTDDTARFDASALAFLQAVAYVWEHTDALAEAVADEQPRAMAVIAAMALLKLADEHSERACKADVVRAVSGWEEGRRK